jgi:taurine dioxygenase
MLLANKLVWFPDQSLTTEQQVALSECLGPLRRANQPRHYPCSHGYAHYIANVDIQGRPTGCHPDPDSAYWHSDGSWSQSPPIATMLYACRCKPGSSFTDFLDMESAYDRLSGSRKKSYSRLYVLHDLELSRAGRNRRWPGQRRDGNSRLSSLRNNVIWFTRHFLAGQRDNQVFHPLVRVHPETGRKALFIGDHAFCVKQWLLPLGVRRLKQLNQWAANSAECYRHRWNSGDLLLWDNRNLLHRADRYDLAASKRIMRRCVVLDGSPNEKH